MYCHPHANVTNLPSGLFQAARIKIQQGQVCTISSQPQCGRPPNSVGAAGDYHNPVLQGHLHFSR
jgi:hypothetical protein